MPADTIKWIEINLKVLDTINVNRSIIGSTEVVWVELCKADTLCLWKAYQYAQTLCICLIWMWEAV